MVQSTIDITLSPIFLKLAIISLFYVSLRFDAVIVGLFARDLFNTAFES